VREETAKRKKITRDQTLAKGAMMWTPWLVWYFALLGGPFAFRQVLSSFFRLVRWRVAACRTRPEQMFGMWTPMLMLMLTLDLRYRYFGSYGLTSRSWMRAKLAIIQVIGNFCWSVVCDQYNNSLRLPGRTHTNTIVIMNLCRIVSR
jgi:hypothetical protein